MKDRVGLAVFLERVDVEQATAIYQAAAETLGEIPCRRHRWKDERNVEAGDEKCVGYRGDPVDAPKHHQTCPRCFCWRDCTDHDCDHPACGGGVTGRFRDEWMNANEEISSLDVLIARDDPVPLAEHGRMSILERELEPDEQTGRKMLEHLTRTRGRWQQVYDMRGVDVFKATAGEVWLLRERVPVEVAHAHYHLACWVALDLARGVDPAANVGGGYTPEMRLTEASTAGTLDGAPGLVQGALF